MTKSPKLKYEFRFKADEEFTVVIEARDLDEACEIADEMTMEGFPERIVEWQQVDYKKLN